MSDYKRMYYKLFNAVTDAIDALNGKTSLNAKRILINAQRDTEELFIESEKISLDNTIEIKKPRSRGDAEQ